MSSLLICSLGNPGTAYAKTLHSAGHVFLNALNKSLATSSGTQNFFIKDRSFGNGTMTEQNWTHHDGSSHSWTLWQSCSFMNESGSGVRSAWTEFIRQQRSADRDVVPRLVIVHDEMREDDKAFGTLSFRPNAIKLSARGHNGIKSVKQSLSGADYIKVGINIGRPAARDPKTVADYVLRKMTPTQVVAIEKAADRFSIELLRLLTTMGTNG